ncbi:MAG: helix-turn-helix domain-containing protein, partial [Ilumatobacteraceae bacterium]
MVVDVLRHFNRSYTQRIGVLDESYLHTGRPLGPSRLLFEIAVDGSSVLELRRRLGLDSGYVSRLLGQLTSEGLVTVDADPADRRQRI